MLQAIHPREFVDKNWTKKDAKERAAGILHMTEMFNTRSYWVASEILSREDSALRTNLIKTFIEIADICLQLHNFYGVFAIVAGLALTPVFRLQSDWARLPSAPKAKLDALKAVCDNSRNYRGYRRLFKAGIGKAQIPHLAVVTKDCFQLEELPTKDEQGNICFGKFLKQWVVLGDVIACQEIEYHLTVDEHVFALLDVATTQHVLLEEKLWQRSYRFQPKGSTQDK